MGEDQADFACPLPQQASFLIANARQAMPAGGKIVLETARTHFDAAALGREPWAAEGDWAEVTPYVVAYVVLEGLP